MASKSLTINDAVDSTVLRNPRQGIYNFGFEGDDALNGQLPVFLAPLSDKLQAAASIWLERVDLAAKASPLVQFMSSPLPTLHAEYIFEVWKIIRCTLGLGVIFDNEQLLNDSDNAKGLGVLFYGSAVTDLSFHTTLAPAFPASGDVFIKSLSIINVPNDFYQDNVDLSHPFMDFPFVTFVHETLHALGLGHVGDYNDDSDRNLIWNEDSYDESVMSYIDQDTLASLAPDGALRWPTEDRFLLPITPRTLDFAALDRIYASQFGNNGTPFGLTNAFNGDTKYGFNSNIDPAVSSVYAQISDLLGTRLSTRLPNVNGYVQGVAITIADASGVDSLDFSGYANSCTIDLYVMTGNEYRSRLSSVNGIYGNLSFAIGTVIENAIGGDGDDEFYDNEMDNTLSGRRGDDWFQITGGDDLINGGPGIDTVRLIGGLDDYEFVSRGDSIIAFSKRSEASVKLIGVEYVELLNGTQVLAIEDALNVRNSLELATVESGNRLRFKNGQEDIYSMRKEGWAGGDSGIVKNFDREDEIDMRSIDADLTRDGLQAFSYVGNRVFSGQAGELRFSRGMLSADLDGDVTADFFLKLSKGENFSFNMQNLIL